MNKKLLVSLVAALLLVSITACAKDKKPDNTDSTTTNNGNVIVLPGTDSNGNPVTGTQTPGQVETPDISDPNPTFTDVTKKVCVVTAAGTVRSSTVIADNNGIGWPSEGTVLDVTGESKDWYRIDWKGKTGYIAKRIVGDNSVFDSFKNIEGEGEEVTIGGKGVAAVNVRSYPSAESDNTIRGSLTKGTKVTRVAVSENWSRILYEVKSETETDASGKPKTEIKQYYISNDCILTAADLETSTAVETTTAADTTK